MIIQIVYTPQHHNTESQSHNTESHINTKENTYIQEILPYIGIIYIHYSGALYSGVAVPSVERGEYVLL